MLSLSIHLTVLSPAMLLKRHLLRSQALHWRRVKWLFRRITTIFSLPLERAARSWFHSTRAGPFLRNQQATTLRWQTSGGSALSVAVDPSSTPRLFYIGETGWLQQAQLGGLRAFNYSSLSVLRVERSASSSPIASGGSAPTFILPVTTPDYVYVANGVGNITGFTVTGSSSPVIR